MEIKMATPKNILRTIAIAAFMYSGMNVKGQCTAMFTSIVDPANNGHVSFTHTATCSGSIYYSWDYGDGNTDFFSQNSNPTHTYTLSGTYVGCLAIVALDSGFIDSYSGFLGTVVVVS